MIIKNDDVRKIIKKTITLVISVVLIFISLKLAVFYMPFLIAFILYFFIEPIIKFCMTKLKMKRKTSSLLILFIVIALIIGLIIWGIATVVSEASNLLNNLNNYITLISEFIQNITNKFDYSKMQVSKQLTELIENSTQNLLAQASEWIKEFFTGLLIKLTSVPTIVFYIVITIISLYFICTDKFYMIDQLEHHLPASWVKRLNKHIREIVSSLGGYLKAQVILIVISFVISVVGLYIFFFMGLNVKYPLLVALGIGFIDALPILGSGMVMVPWAIIAACKGDIVLGISIFVLWVVMTIVRQMIEPKIVGSQIGIHPIFTVIAMYTGFKIQGVLGLFVGPIILIILKNVFASTIDKGLVKSIVE